MNRKLPRAIALAVVCLALAQCAPSTTTTEGPPTAFSLWKFTASGALDTTFPGGVAGQKGFTSTSISPGGFSFALGAAIQPADDKIVVTGSNGLAGSGTVALVRYASNGTVDTTFNSTGIVQTPLTNPAAASAIAVQPDGKIVVAALTFNLSNSNTGIAVLRYTSSGALDTTFNSTGVVETASIGPGLVGDTCSLVLQPDGNILVAGGSQNGNVVLFRYKGTDGSLDTTFNGTGSVTTNLGSGNVAMSPGLALLPDNSIILVTGNNLDQVVLHYSTAGVLDATFGGTPNGIVTTDVGGGQNFANAVTVQSDGKIVVVGHANVSATTSDISLVRYNADGTLDPTFGGGSGTVLTDRGGFDNAFSVALQSPLAATTNILVSGNTGSGGGSLALVMRYDTNGVLDTGFNPANGFVTPPLFGPSNIASGNVVLQTTSGIIVVGFD